MSQLGAEIDPAGMSEMPRMNFRFPEPVFIPPHVTTLLVRLGRFAKQDELIALWPPELYSYNFLYLPFNANLRRASGQAFINFTSNAAAVAFRDKWHGAIIGSRRLAPTRILVADVQGFAGNLRALRDRSVEDIIQEKYLPAVFFCSERVDIRKLLAHAPL